MKKLQIFLLATAGCLAITSCSDDENMTPMNNAQVNDALEGTYQLTAFTAPAAQDYDNDGDTSSNLVLEGSCYNDSWIAFHSDGTYDESINSSTVASGGATLECNAQFNSGTYERDGDTILTHVNGQTAVTATYTFDAATHTLTSMNSNGSYAAWDASNSLWATLTGNLQLTFVKYTDDDQDNGTTADTDGPNDDENNGNFALVGNFGLSAFVVATAQNLDNDGDSSTNLVTESNCYAESNITFREDGTYQQNSTRSVLGSLGLSLTCDTETTFGTWTREGDTVTTHRNSSGSGSINTSFTFDAATKTLTRTDSNGEYAGFSTVTNLFVMLNGVVNYTYTKA